jgi:ribosomal protein S27E
MSEHYSHQLESVQGREIRRMYEFLLPLAQPVIVSVPTRNDEGRKEESRLAVPLATLSALPQGNELPFNSLELPRSGAVVICGNRERMRIFLNEIATLGVGEVICEKLEYVSSNKTKTITCSYCGNRYTLDSPPSRTTCKGCGAPLPLPTGRDKKAIRGTPVINFHPFDTCWSLRDHITGKKEGNVTLDDLKYYIDQKLPLERRRRRRRARILGLLVLGGIGNFSFFSSLVMENEIENAWKAFNLIVRGLMLFSPLSEEKARAIVANTLYSIDTRICYCIAALGLATAIPLLIGAVLENYEASLLSQASGPLEELLTTGAAQQIFPLPDDMNLLVYPRDLVRDRDNSYRDNNRRGVPMLLLNDF